MQVTLIAHTEPSAAFKAKTPIELHTIEGIVAYAARVSSPHQDKDQYEGLLKYCWRKGHVSIFETVSATVEIETSLAIATQILRHRSFTFQQFSQRYADASGLGFEEVVARKQGVTNRQGSTDVLDRYTKTWFYNLQIELEAHAKRSYDLALEVGIAKECARFLLPQSTTTRLYMTGSLRSWLHYLQVRCTPETQEEHRVVALEVMRALEPVFPLTFEVVFGRPPPTPPTIGGGP